MLLGLCALACHSMASDAARPEQANVATALSQPDQTAGALPAAVQPLLTPGERLQLLRAAQLELWLALPVDLPVALCVQSAVMDWPRAEPQDQDVEHWRLAWERCDLAQEPARGSMRLVAQARKNLQGTVQRLEVAWRERMACTQLALQQPAQGISCLHKVLGSAPSDEEARLLLARQVGVRRAQGAR